MIKISGIDHVAIRVCTLDASLKFYTEVLGLSISQREHQKPGIEFFLDCGPSVFGLIQGDFAGERHALQGKGIGGDHISFHVPPEAFDSAVEALKSSGVGVDFVKKREKSWSAYFKDPDGNKLEITAWPLEV